MEVASFCRQSRVVVVAGKGGVGKSTMVAALGKMAAEAGLSVLIVELEGKPGISAAFGRPETLGYEESLLSPQADPGERPAVRARRITPDDALLEYLNDHGLRRVSKRLVSAGVLDVVATAIPGIRDVLVLGKVKRLERDEVADLILLADPTRCRVVLVTLPEEMPVSETVDAAYQVEDRAGVRLGPVIVNGLSALTPGLQVPATE